MKHEVEWYFVFPIEKQRVFFHVSLPQSSRWGYWPCFWSLNMKICRVRRFEITWNQWRFCCVSVSGKWICRFDWSTKISTGHTCNITLLDPQFASNFPSNKRPCCMCRHVSAVCVCVCPCSERQFSGNWRSKDPQLVGEISFYKNHLQKKIQKSGNILDTIVPKCGFGPISINSNHQGPHAFLLYLSAPFP